LSSAVRTALDLAAQHGCRSITLPALSTGAYRYPLDQAARVAISTAAEFLHQLPTDSALRLVRFVLFSADAITEFQHTLNHQRLIADSC
jgi:O-acetyl-ADP-ribose deacetylase (regulator of RNase III)